MARELRPCGTEAAYKRHQRADEEPCEACLEAHAAGEVERRRRARGGGARGDAPPVDLSMWEALGDDSSRLDELRALVVLLRSDLPAVQVLDPSKLPGVSAELRRTWAEVAELEAAATVDNSDDVFAAFFPV